MTTPALKTCPHFGPFADGNLPAKRRFSSAQLAAPLVELPPPITLSDVERELAEKYEQGDLSGGYVESQVAHFRRGPTAVQHRLRREKFQELRADLDGGGYRLPAAFVELVENDDYVARLRHDTIWLHLPDEVVGLPSDPDHKLFLMFAEGQGGGYWHLLLSPDGSHVVTFSEHPYGLSSVLPAGYDPDQEELEVYRCAESFAEWILHYFAKCKAADDRYAELLKAR